MVDEPQPRADTEPASPPSDVVVHPPLPDPDGPIDPTMSPIPVEAFSSPPPAAPPPPAPPPPPGPAGGAARPPPPAGSR
jgi:hypothetical protein